MRSDGTVTGPGYVYVRPLAVEVLIAIFNLNKFVMVLWSAGGREYVHEVVYRVLEPKVRQLMPQFKFDAVLTADDTEGWGFKNLNKINAPGVLLIDDNRSQCMMNACLGYDTFRVEPYDPFDTDTDMELLRIMQHSWFSYQ